jgi:outer membrane protein TolC
MCGNFTIFMICLCISTRISAQPLSQPLLQTAPTAHPRPEQGLPDSNGHGWGAAAALSADSLEQRIAELEQRRATLAVDETSFWNRLMPTLNISAGFSFRDLVFIDPMTAVATYFPRDTYRITLSLSINDILDERRYERACISLEECSAKLEHLRAARAVKHDQEIRRLASIQSDLRLQQEELDLVQKLVRYYELQFEQGEIRFDTLLRARLQLLNVRASILRLQNSLYPDG